MILNDKGAPIEGPGEVDAPPAYDELEPSRNPSRFSADQKTPIGSGAFSPQAGPSNSREANAASSRSSQHNGASGANKTWFSWFSEKDTRMEVKRTIQSLVSRRIWIEIGVSHNFVAFLKMRDVVKEPASPAAVSVLQSCLEACQNRGLSFQSVVSEKFIEGHCPLYWAIIKRPSTSSEQDDDDRVQLLDILLSIPLDSTTRSEAYLACMLSSDQVLFQRLRHTPGDHSPSVSAAHELLLGDAPEDDIRSFDRDGDHGEFQIVWRIAKFQKRMRALGGVGTEVVARGWSILHPIKKLFINSSGRIWSLALSILPRDIRYSRIGTLLKAGTWVASVSLLAPSPSTYLDAQLSIPEPTPESISVDDMPSSSTPTPPSHPPGSPNQSSLPKLPTKKHSLVPWSISRRSSCKPPITLRIKTDVDQLVALPIQSTKQDLRDHVLSDPGYKTLIVPLSNHPNGDSLQFE